MKSILLIGSLLINFATNANQEVNIYEYDFDDSKSISSIEIKDAINSVQDGTVLFFPNGKYILDRTIFIESKNITLKGESESNTIFTYPKQFVNEPSKDYSFQTGYKTSYPRMFEIEANNVKIENITFDAVDLVLKNSDLIMIKSGANDFLLNHVTIKNIHGTGTTQQYAVRIDGAGVNNYLITNSTFDNIKQNGGNDGVAGKGFVGAIYIYWGKLYNERNLTPSNGTISNSLFSNIYTAGDDPDADAIRFSLKKSKFSFNTIISNNRFIDIQKRAVKVGNANGVSIVGNHISSNRSDFCMRAAVETLSNSQNIIISDNTAEGKLTNGIVLAGDSLTVKEFNFNSSCATVENGIQIGANFDINADTVTIDNVNISKANRGIYAFFNSKNIVVKNINIGRANNFGLVIFPGSEAVTVSNLHVDRGPFAWIEGVYKGTTSIVKDINIYNSGSHFDPENINRTSLIINAAKNVKFSRCYVDSNSKSSDSL